MSAPRVTGIGGFFFLAKDPDALALWYETNLGVSRIPQDSSQQAWRQEGGPTAFAPFPADTEYFGSGAQGWMLNFRVQGLDALIAKLRQAGIQVALDPEAQPYGRFARMADPEGNP